jgi:hypothetical protein
MPDTWIRMGELISTKRHKKIRPRLAEPGIEDAVAEKVLSHKLREILKVYDRHLFGWEGRSPLVLTASLGWKKGCCRRQGISLEKVLTMPLLSGW